MSNGRDHGGGLDAAIAASLVPGRTGKVMLRLGERPPSHHFRQTTSLAE